MRTTKWEVEKGALSAAEKGRDLDRKKDINLSNHQQNTDFMGHNVLIFNSSLDK